MQLSEVNCSDTFQVTVDVIQTGSSVARAEAWNRIRVDKHAVQMRIFWTFGLFQAISVILVLSRMVTSMLLTRHTSQERPG